MARVRAGLEASSQQNIAPFPGTQTSHKKFGEKIEPAGSKSMLWPESLGNGSFLDIPGIILIYFFSLPVDFELEILLRRKQTLMTAFLSKG